MKIGTWNVKSIYQAGKLHNVIQEMERLNIKILGLSETRWPNSGDILVGQTKIYYSGNDNDPNHWNGVAILVDKTTQKFVTGFLPISDRVMMVTLKTAQSRVNIFQVYAPTADKSDEELEQFYSELQQALEVTKSRDVTMVIGDLNAKIGRGSQGNFIGKFGLGTRNERGERLAQFCQENDFIVANTYYDLPARRLYTWKSPADNQYNIIRNQIDYLLICKRYRNSIKSVKSYPGADVRSDHNPVVGRFRINLKKLVTAIKVDRIQVSRLGDPSTKEQVTQKIKEELTKIEIIPTEDANRKWHMLKNALRRTCETTLAPKPIKNKNEWMTEEILNLMEERRSYKTKDKNMYNIIHTEIRRKIREAKERWYSDRCEEIEQLVQKHDSQNLYKKIREITGTNIKRKSNILLDKNGKIIIDVGERLKRWQEYIQELFKDERTEILLEKEEFDGGPDITEDEVLEAIKRTKNNKATGPDQIPVDIIRLIEQQQIGILVDLFNTIYSTGIIPRDWLISTFITLPKKPNAKECQDHRIISLMSHTLKIFLKIIHRRIHNKLEQDISDTQFGFRDALGTREALFAVNVLVQRCMDVNQPVYMCFLDYNKAFDKVRHNRLIELLEKKNLDMRDIRIISTIYYNQIAVVKENNVFSNEIRIERGVRQGCVLSPILFNLYSEEIIQEALEELTTGIKVNGRAINNIRFADDTILLAECLEDLQQMVDRVVEVSEENGLSLNTKKTQFMVITKAQQRQESITIHGEQIKKVEKYKYLGTIINENNDYKEEIKVRIGQARNAFNKLKKVFCSRDITISLKIRLLRCYVFSVLFYGLEAWTLKKDVSDRLEAFELWAYRRILRISWVDRVTNVEVLRRMGKEREVLNTIKVRKLQYLGHVMRGERYNLLQLIIQGRIQGTRSRGRRRISWLNNLRAWFNCTSADLFRAAASKVRIAMMIANLLRGDGT